GCRRRFARRRAAASRHRRARSSTSRARARPEAPSRPARPLRRSTRGWSCPVSSGPLAAAHGSRAAQLGCIAHKPAGSWVPGSRRLYNHDMGLALLTIDVANPADLSQRERVEFLIDSGAVFSFVPRAVLDRLGIAPYGRQRFPLADGSSIERDRGDAVYFY